MSSKAVGTFQLGIVLLQFNRILHSLLFHRIIVLIARQHVVAHNWSMWSICFLSLLACRPCKGICRPYEKLAKVYDKAVFIKLFGNANIGCKRLFMKFKIKSTPSFLFFRQGALVSLGR
eukprot:GHRR01036173.1.p1 GENE.GHRR01036173.1~~GHRR01036173.1.p1  ORF type:complete len:119 (-),score=21.02 GHRR01036173.1:399-755(-)